MARVEQGGCKGALAFAGRPDRGTLDSPTEVSAPPDGTASTRYRWIARQSERAARVSMTAGAVAFHRQSGRKLKCDGHRPTLQV